jgi:GGDEF domain-containing protein
MPSKDRKQFQMLIILLCGAIITAAFFVVQINPYRISFVYLILLITVITVGLFSSIWGGIFASAAAGIIIIVINQYEGIYLRENTFMNISGELIFFLLSGPLAGLIAKFLEHSERRLTHWQRLAEENTVHDQASGILKPEWILVRLEEEMHRAKRFNRPLSVVLLQWIPDGLQQIDRYTAFRNLARISRAATQLPTVLGHAGSGQVVLILPEYQPEQIQSLIDEIHERAKREINNHLFKGKVLPSSATNKILQYAAAAFNGQSTSQELLDQVRSELHG